MDKHIFIGRHGFFHISKKSFIYYKYPTFSVIWDRNIKILFFNWFHFCWYIGRRFMPKNHIK